MFFSLVQIQNKGDYVNLEYEKGVIALAIVQLNLKRENIDSHNICARKLGNLKEVNAWRACIRFHNFPLEFTNWSICTSYRYYSTYIL